MKIDKIFINSLTSTGADTPVLDTIVGLSKRLDLTTIAEGATAAHQVEWLIKNQEPYMQGYYYGQPWPVADFFQWYKEKCVSLEDAFVVGNQREEDLSRTMLILVLRVFADTPEADSSGVYRRKASTGIAKLQAGKVIEDAGIQVGHIRGALFGAISGVVMPVSNSAKITLFDGINRIPAPLNETVVTQNLIDGIFY